MLNMLNETDPEEQAILLSTMGKRVSRPPRYDPHMRAVRAFKALKAIAAAAPDNDQNWDGVLWWERLQDAADGSLAEHLMREGDAAELALAWLKAEYKTN
ncbi:hypothetical protein [Pseudomonas sp.]|uniref:hypothetical protein n=1 Tax=Pseudomonas sp. TaxID=306 RepID=UPI003FD6CBAE